MSMVMAATNFKIKELDEENNMMWDEIKAMSVIIPEKSSLNNVSTHDRQSFLTADAKTRIAGGKHSPPPNLSTSKQYRGPEIKPTMPTYIKDKLNYQE